MGWCACGRINAKVLRARNLSLNGKDHRPCMNLGAASKLVIARSALASLIGKVVAFCREKICRCALAPGSVGSFPAKSTRKDKDRTSGFKSGFTCAAAFANRTLAGYIPGVANIPLESRAANRGPCRALAS